MHEQSIPHNDNAFNRRNVRRQLEFYTKQSYERTVEGMSYSRIREGFKALIQDAIEQGATLRISKSAEYTFESKGETFELRFFTAQDSYYMRMFCIVFNQGSGVGMASLSRDRTREDIQYDIEIAIEESSKGKGLAGAVQKCVKYELGILALSYDRPLILTFSNYNALNLVWLSKNSDEQTIIKAEQEQSRWHSSFGTTPKVANNLDWLYYSQVISPLSKDELISHDELNENIRPVEGLEKRLLSPDEIHDLLERI